MGEALLAAGLVRRLRARFPDSRIVVSTATPTGQDIAREKLAASADAIFYAPFDFPWAVRATMRAVKPGLLIVLETEIWPNLFREAKRHGAGLLMVNGRISDKSATRYTRWRRLFRPVLEECDWILAQSRLDAERFVAAGAPQQSVRVGGNLKYDFEPGAAELPAPLAELIEALAPETVLLAGSTREEEEAPVVEAFRRIAGKRPRSLLVVAPRHPPRFDEVYEELERAGLPVLRRSQLPDQASLPAILLLDSLGELSSLYARADAVFMGGSLNGWGGHNPLEPALHGKPVVGGSPYAELPRDCRATSGGRSAGGDRGAGGVWRRPGRICWTSRSGRGRSASGLKRWPRPSAGRPSARRRRRLSCCASRRPSSRLGFGAA